MEKHGIAMPTKITEYFIDTKHNKKSKKMNKIFNEIKNDIKNHELMFKKVERSKEYTTTEETLKKDTYIVKILQNITCIDFNDQKKIIINVLSEKEETLSELNKISSEIEDKYTGKADKFRWYDYFTGTLFYWVRPKYKYKIDEFDYHKIGNKKIKKQKKPSEYVWKII